MPFTISHAAAVLPFARRLNRWRALSAVVIGSMVPDFVLLAPWNVQRVDSHSIHGLWTFCLPVGLLCYWLFEYIVKPATWEVLPDAVHERSRALATPDPIGSPRQWLVAVLGVLAGAVTHLAWDGFTHEGARGVRLFPVLDDSVDVAGHSLYAYHLAQHVSSVLGLALVLYLIGAAMRASPAVPPLSRALDRRMRHRWMGAYVAAALVFATLSVELTWTNKSWGRSWAYLFEATAVGGLRGLLYSLLAVSALLMASLRAARRNNG
jgi:hypothetical protein